MQRRRFLGRLGAATGATLAVAGVQAQAPSRRAAARATTVEAVQMPAWVDRGGERQPLAPGDALAAADEVRTGPGAALVLRLPEGSTVRLGEKTRLAFETLEAVERDDKVRVQSRLKLFDGFLRFTTSAIAKARGDRQVDVTLRTATIGIRGTDFWSMTDEEHDAACLFEGRVALATRDQGDLALDQPTAFWARFFQRPVQPVGNATPQQLATFLGSTELRPGAGIAVPGGAWQVVAFSGPDSRMALRVAGRLRAEGYPARMASRGGTHLAWIDELASEADAQAVLGRISTVEGVQGRVRRTG